MNKRAIATGLIVLLVLCLLTACDTSIQGPSEQGKSDDKSTTYNISSDSVKVYYKGQYGEDQDEITMYFLNDNKQIAYYDMDTVIAVMTKLYREGYGDFEKDKNYSLSYIIDGDKITFSRENGYTMVIDFGKDTISFHNYDKFICHSYDTETVDLLHSSGYDENGQPVYLQRDSESSFSRNGEELVLHPGKYGIDLVAQNGEFLIPAQTMNDILLTATYTLYLYNGEAAIYTSYDCLTGDIDSGTGLAEIYYRDTNEKRSKELIDYTYNELCMVLDFEYGLKESHQIEDFDTYFKEIEVDGLSLKEMLNSEDPVESEKALYTLAWHAFDDIHSKYLAPSFYAGLDTRKELNETYSKGLSFTSFDNTRSELKALRASILGDENGHVQGYLEVGNTAYITFDNFLPKTENYYANPPESEPKDTIGLLIYAHSRIKRDDSPIENVVIDLSCNSGGAEDAVAFVCAWFLGDAQIYFQNSTTAASSVNVYSCDTNLDHKFDRSDSVADLNLYCLISPVSFSCGNLAPTMFECSGNITLIGQTTGGGSCIVLPLTTASGSILQVSGFKMVCGMKNGSFYNADTGVDPDFIIRNCAHFYDREYMTSYINSLP